MRNILSFWFFLKQWNGVFVKKTPIHKELKPLYDSAMSRQYIGVVQDKQNLNSDFYRIKSDFKKSLNAYKHGEKEYTR
jgi:hypothetical protein